MAMQGDFEHAELRDKDQAECSEVPRAVRCSPLRHAQGWPFDELRAGTLSLRVPFMTADGGGRPAGERSRHFGDRRVRQGGVERKREDLRTDTARNGAVGRPLGGHRGLLRYGNRVVDQGLDAVRVRWPASRAHQRTRSR